ncbi:hypothetical protein HMPREF0673_02041 [Leyella stercorea DSM 18206]|uniref:Uncharacterized protein n=1 Tax=Leyella stercorea DSM 18206 TaxID=1002367 RepID=G6AZH7_9BACT|nr:hypothetical protein HMPREF0673_02041 [Leyella stercorea DSM 18206]
MFCCSNNAGLDFIENGSVNPGNGEPGGKKESVPAGRYAYRTA